jgi:hypothetical protein
MEINATEIRANAPAAAQPIVVSDVAVKDRKDQVETEPDPARRTAAVTQRRRVPELVKQAGKDREQ